jgi:Ca-activated chloride channel family protein
MAGKKDRTRGRQDLTRGQSTMQQTTAAMLPGEVSLVLRRAALLALVAGLAAVSPMVAQQPVTPPSSPAATPSQTPGQTPEPNVTQSGGGFVLQANAFDPSGHEVDSLPEDAFHVYEDGVPQKIVGFSHDDVPVSLGLLIDNSGSMYDKSAAVDAAALDLVKLSNPQDEEFLVDFSSEAYIDQDFTSSIAKLQQGLSYIKPGGGTALYDDGDDNASAATLESTIRRVQDLDGPAIYCIGLLFGEDVSRSEAKHSKDVLTQLAEETGGMAFFPRSLKEVDGIAQQVAQDIRSQYTIEYHSTKPPADGGYRTIHVEVKEKGFRKLQARTRSGYFPKVAQSSTGDKK